MQKSFYFKPFDGYIESGTGYLYGYPAPLIKNPVRIIAISDDTAVIIWLEDSGYVGVDNSFSTKHKKGQLDTFQLQSIKVDLP